ncbi:MAG: hypothetical protein HKO98_09200 [Gemmatimonadetes bacterium]|nr:hypothetical protein [Gemmatimonadota bacterium]
MRAWILLSLGLLLAPGVAAQSADPFISSGREMSRTDLEAYLANLEQAILDESQGESLREQARARAQLIRRRLEEGDFRVGDRIQVQVAGENWTNQSPGAIAPARLVAPAPGSPSVPTGQGAVGVTFAVQSGPSVKLPNIPAVSLRGVLRSELEAYLSGELARYIRDPQVSAQTLIRVSIFGSVGAPGFYYPGAEQNVGDVIMLAGGPSSDANYEEISIKRGEDQLWGGEELQAVMAEGRTLDQLNFLAGDIIEVPQQSNNNVWLEIGRFALIAGSTLLLGIRVF